jgi:hypothetical protein
MRTVQYVYVNGEGFVHYNPLSKGVAYVGMICNASECASDEQVIIIVNHLLFVEGLSSRDVIVLERK